MAPLLRLGRGVGSGFQHCDGAEDHRRAGAPFLGPRSAQDLSWLRHPGRPSGRPEGNIFYAANLDETGRVWHAYQSAWLPQSLLAADQRDRLADALFAAAQHRGVSLHFNKGLAGATAEAIAAAKDTPMNPTVADAFALAISGAGEPPAYPGVPGHEPDVVTGLKDAAAVTETMNAIRKLLPRVGSYVWETDYFQGDLAGRLLGRELRPAARGQGQI